MNKDLLKGLTPEQIERARACKDSKELLAAAKEEGIELTDEQLNAVNGGFGCAPNIKTGFACPGGCGNNTVGIFDQFMFNSRGGYQVKCNDCGCTFEVPR